MATPTPLVKVRVINRPRYFGGMPQPVGAVIEMPPTLAKEWFYNRWGVAYTEPEPAQKAVEEKKSSYPEKTKKGAE